MDRARIEYRPADMARRVPGVSSDQKGGSSRCWLAIGDALAEQHRYEADAYLVHQAEVERLLGDVGAGDRDVFIAGDLPRRGDRCLDSVDEGRPRPPLGCGEG